MIDPAVIQPFSDAVAHSDRHRLRLADDTTPSIGYFCTYTPVELIHAAGFHPLRITGGAGRVENAANLAPDFMCPTMKRSLERALGGEYNHLSGVITGYSCDAACGVTNVWADNMGGDVFRILPLPYNDTPASRLYLRQVLHELAAALDAADDPHFSDRLRASIDLYGRIHQRLLSLYRLRDDGRWPLSTADFYTVVSAAAVMPPEAVLTRLTDLMTGLASARRRPRPGVPVMVSGSIVEYAGVLDAIERFGGRVVADDLCNGYRSLVPAAPPVDDPVEWLIERHFRHDPCPSRARAARRAPLLLERARRRGVRGVIFLVQKYCSPHLADIPALSDALAQAGIPAIGIEMDEFWQIEGQMRTRVEGFFEMMDG